MTSIEYDLGLVTAFVRSADESLLSLRAVLGSDLENDLIHHLWTTTPSTKLNAVILLKRTALEAAQSLQHLRDAEDGFLADFLAEDMPAEGVDPRIYVVTYAKFVSAGFSPGDLRCCCICDVADPSIGADEATMLCMLAVLRDDARVKTLELLPQPHVDQKSWGSAASTDEMQAAVNELMRQTSKNVLSFLPLHKTAGIDRPIVEVNGNNPLPDALSDGGNLICVTSPDLHTPIYYPNVGLVLSSCERRGLMFSAIASGPVLCQVQVGSQELSMQRWYARDDECQLLCDYDEESASSRNPGKMRAISGQVDHFAAFASHVLPWGQGREFLGETLGIPFLGYVRVAEFARRANVMGLNTVGKNPTMNSGQRKQTDRGRDVRSLLPSFAGNLNAACLAQEAQCTSLPDGLRLLCVHMASVVAHVLPTMTLEGPWDTSVFQSSMCGPAGRPHVMRMGSFWVAHGFFLTVATRTANFTRPQKTNNTFRSKECYADVDWEACIVAQNCIDDICKQFGIPNDPMHVDALASLAEEELTQFQTFLARSWAFNMILVPAHGEPFDIKSCTLVEIAKTEVVSLLGTLQRDEGEVRAKTFLVYTVMDHQDGKFLPRNLTVLSTPAVYRLQIPESAASYEPGPLGPLVCTRNLSEDGK